MPNLDPRSRPTALAKLDGRTVEGRLVRDFRARLYDHVGGQPNAAQAALIERATWLVARLAMWDQGGDFAMSGRGMLAYLAATNALTRILKTLGMSQRSNPYAPRPR